MPCRHPRISERCRDEQFGSTGTAREPNPTCLEALASKTVYLLDELTGRTELRTGLTLRAVLRTGSVHAATFYLLRYLRQLFLHRSSRYE